MLALMSERVEKAVSFEKFTQKSKGHVLKNYKKAEDLVPMIVTLIDLTASFEAKYGPTDIQDTASAIEVEKWKMKL